MELYEKRIDSTVIYKGKVFTVKCDTAELANGKRVERELVEHIGGAGILPIDESGNVTLVRQYRYGADAVLTEMCAGKLERCENPKECAVRELREELGLCANEVIPLGVINPTPAYDSEKIYIYIGKGLSGTQLCPDEDEFVEPVTMTLKEAAELVMRGEITDAKTQIAILKAEKMYGEA